MWGRIKEIFCYFSPDVGSRRSESSSSWLNTLCFFIFGTLSFFNQELLYTASEDILSGRKLPTSTILVCFVTPLMVTKILAPWFIQKIPYLVKASYIILCMTLGLALIVFVEDMRAKLVGIALNAMATGVSEVVFLALTSFYPQIAISSFVAGTGTASLISPLYYTGLTTWGCVSPKTAIMMTIPLPVLILVFYAILDKEYIVTAAHAKPTEHEGVEYSIVGSTNEDTEQTTEVPQRPRCGEKLRIGARILPFIIPLFFSFFAEYMSNSSVVTTIAFPKSHIHPRDHFLYYSLSYRIGKFIGRSYLFVFACLPPEATDFLKCDRTWILAAFEMSHLVFFLFESWYHFVPYIWIMIALCSTLGLFAGMIVLHSPHAVARYTKPEEREFALGLLTIGNAVGGFTAGLVGLFVEPYLRDECVQHFSASKEFCFTRMRNTTGWDSNFHC